MKKDLYKKSYRIMMAILCMVLFIGIYPWMGVWAGDLGGNVFFVEDHSGYDAPTRAITGSVDGWKDRPFSYSKSSENARVRFYDYNGNALTPYYYSTEGVTKGRFDAEDSGMDLLNKLGDTVIVTGGKTLRKYLTNNENVTVYYVLQKRFFLTTSTEAYYVYFIGDTEKYVNYTEGPIGLTSDGTPTYAMYRNDGTHKRLGTVYFSEDMDYVNSGATV